MNTGVLSKWPGLVRAPVLLLCAAAFSVGCAGLPRARYRPGVYEGEGQGFRGPIRVAVTLDSGGIQGIEILEHQDDPLIGGAAMEELAELAVAWGSTDPDAVSGATESGAGFLAAVEAALSQGLIR
ncbi:MAG: FMN-binding protein [Treponema sp.]|nr:FMN-binding protein [Treponema sp.]